MKRPVGILLFAIFLAPVLVTAQNGTTRVEVFGGYSFLHTPRGETTFNGWNAAATVNLNNWCGATADVSAAYFDESARLPAVGGVPDRTLRAYGNTSRFLFGPTFSLRRSRYTPFAHVLFGFSRGKQHNEFSILGTSSTFDATSNAFSTSLGGGIDVNLSSRIALRPLQADYVLDRRGSSNFNHLRYSAGVVFRFGAR